MTEITADAEAPASATEAPRPDVLPEGEYAILEVLGHRTMVGRISEVERFGAKLCAIEPLFAGNLLPTVMVGGASIYQLTPCSAATALARAPKERWQMPASIAATLPAAALPAPADDTVDHDFSARFLDDDADEETF